MIIALVLGLSTGIISAVKQGTFLDYGANVVALAGISVPHFWLGIMMIFLFFSVIYSAGCRPPAMWR